MSSYRAQLWNDKKTVVWKPRQTGTKRVVMYGQEVEVKVYEPSGGLELEATYMTLRSEIEVVEGPQSWPSCDGMGLVFWRTIYGGRLP